MSLRPLGRVLTLAAWAGFFIWLLATGEIERYIGPRTRWVVVFGGIMLVMATIAQARSWLRHPNHASLSRAEFAGLLVLVAPIAVIILIPRPSLGSEAAERRSTGLVGAVGTFVPIPNGNEDVSFKEIQYASESADYAARLGIVDGYRVELTGFVTHPGHGGQGTFSLTRFATFCCAADAVPFSVPVDAGSDDYPDDTWLTISGPLRDRGGEFVLEAKRIRETREPANPYI